MRLGARLTVLCAAIAAGTGAAIVFAVSGGHGSNRAAVAQATSACTTAQARRLAGLDPHSDTLAFVRYDRGSYAIFVMSASGGPARRLSAAPPHPLPAPQEQFQDAPNWSPDGAHIAFASDRDRRSGIYVMDADGTNTRRLTTSKAGDSTPSWSPNGRLIVFSRGAGGLYVIGADGQAPKRLTVAQFSKDLDPAWSPDGSRIVFVRKELGRGSALFAIRPDGRGLCELTPFATSVLAPAWSPDGARLVYSSDEGLGFEILVVNADGSGRRALTAPGLDFHPAWSPDGRRIAFQREATLYLMDANGAHIHRLTAPKAIDGSPSWRPPTA